MPEGSVRSTTDEPSVDVWPLEVLLASYDDERGFADDPDGPVQAVAGSPPGAPLGPLSCEPPVEQRRVSFFPVAAGAAAVAVFLALVGGRDESTSIGGHARVPAAGSEGPAASRPATEGSPDGVQVVATTTAPLPDTVSDEQRTTPTAGKPKRRRGSPAGADPSPVPAAGPESPATQIQVPGVATAVVDLPGGAGATVTVPGLPPISVTTPELDLPSPVPGGPSGGEN